MLKNSYHTRIEVKQTSVLSELKRNTFTEDVANYNEILSIIFREDYDITSLHQKIIAKITYESSTVRFLETKIKRIKDRIAGASTNFEAIQFQAELREIEAKHKIVSNNERLSEYREAAEPFLQKYVYLRRPPRCCIGYLHNAKQQKIYYEPTEIDLERIRCIVSYLDVAKKYYRLEYYCNGYFKELPWYACEFCEEDLTTCPMDKFGMAICPACFEPKQLRNICFSVDKNDPDAPTAPKPNNNIVKALYEFQGKIPPKTDYETMARELDEYFQSIGFVSAEEIRGMKCLPDGKKPGTTMLFMRKGIIALVKQYGKNYQKFYNSARFMCQYLWGWILEDLSSIENAILVDDNLLEEGYSRIPLSVKCRTSSIPIQIRLYFHLKRHNVSCEREDFKLPKEISKYNRLLKLACENTGVLVYSPI